MIIVSLGMFRSIARRRSRSAASIIRYGTTYIYMNQKYLRAKHKDKKNIPTTRPTAKAHGRAASNKYKTIGGVTNAAEHVLARRSSLER